MSESLSLLKAVEGHSPYDVIDAVNETGGTATTFGDLDEPLDCAAFASMLMVATHKDAIWCVYGDGRQGIVIIIHKSRLPALINHLNL